MPYGPGKFEGEPASTFFLYHVYLEGDMNEIYDSYSKWCGRLFPGAVEIEAAKVAGWTAEEILDSLVEMDEMSGAILAENDMGFLTATVYGPDDALELDEAWQKIIGGEESDENSEV